MPNDLFAPNTQPRLDDDINDSLHNSECTDDAPQPDCLQTLTTTFSTDFWQQTVARMLAHASSVPLTRQLIIVPDNSMILAYRAAWAEQARQTQKPYPMPPMMTLMDWAKSNGAQDWDAHDTERMLNWMQVLPSAQVLREALGQRADEADDVLGLSRLLIEMSDELSIHLLAGRDVAWVKHAVNQAVDAVYQRQTHQLAQQELAILLHCWQADVDKQTPVVRYLAVLQQMARDHAASNARPYDAVWVLRNRPWSAHEQHFWHNYARHVTVYVLDIQSVAVRAGLERQRAILSIAGESAQRWASAPLTDEARAVSAVQFIRAQNLEDEAQTVVRQVLQWREQGLRQIALIALDRQVSRRVWALLRRVGVDIRDDTGWLLSTSRAASAWHRGLALLHGEVLAKDLLEWLAHPLVLANWAAERKQALLALVYTLADRQHSYQKKRVWRSWDDWLKALRALAWTDQVPAHADAQMLFEQGRMYARRWQSARTLSTWAHELIEWANSFGLWAALENDAAGQKWCELLRRWQWLENTAQWPLRTALQLMNTAVERLTYRPPSMNVSAAANDAEVTLLPLGNTRLRTFDAVWLLGADASNLPGAEQDLGLLNLAVRRDLGLPTAQDKQWQMRIALLDILALNPQVCASFAAQKDGTPNALSPWLQQYLRAQGGQIADSERVECHVTPQSHARSAISIAQQVPGQISATDLSNIAACPYQYYAKKVLNIAPVDWPDDEIAASDKGNVWHALVERFHQRRQAHAPEQDTACFMQVLDELLDPLCAENPRYWPLKQLFASYEPAFVAWWQARERAGWQVKYSEYAPQACSSQTIRDERGLIRHELQWRGRIDQVDESINEQGQAQWSLIDYKTNNLFSYKQRIRDHEETQLAFYIHLIESGAQAQVVDARYVGVDRHAERRLPEAPLGDVAYIHAQAAQLRQQVHDVFLQMLQGVPLMALGEKGACVYCDYRAICRKDYAAPMPSVSPEHVLKAGGGQ